MIQHADDENNWFAAEESIVKPHPATSRWRVLIVDDEPDVHAVTRLALNKIVFKDKEIDILSAYSAEEGYQMMRDEPDIGMVLLDVVMETDDAGLRLVRRIRDELNNLAVRIILRTGQPGQAPEQKVIIDYDINDYKLKTDLTASKMLTTVISSLRAYEGIKTVEASRQGLEKILQAVSNLYQLDSLKELATGVLTQIGAILGFGTDGVLCVMHARKEQQRSGPVVIAATGTSMPLVEQQFLPPDHPWTPAILQTFRDQTSFYAPDVNVLSIQAKDGYQFAVAFSPRWTLNALERSLLDIFCNRIAAAFDNLHMFDLLKTTQEATVIALADLAESRDATTGGHVRRVCKLTNAIALELQRMNKLPADTDPNFLTSVGIASILHDIGKVAIPDAILLKPGRHTPEERVIMEGHAMIGETVLAHASSTVEGVSSLSIGAEIAGGHHEHFDGNGYPRALKGEQIPLSARIVAVVDVFDALLHSRPYKPAWPLQEALDYIDARSGSQFDPDVVTALRRFLASEEPDWIVAEGH